MWTCGFICGGLLPTAVTTLAASDIGVPLEFATNVWLHTLHVVTIGLAAAAAHMFTGSHPNVGLGLALVPGLYAVYLTSCLLQWAPPRFVSKRSVLFIAASFILAAYIPEVGLSGYAGGAAGGVLATLMAAPALKVVAWLSVLVFKAMLAGTFVVLKIGSILVEMIMGFVYATAKTSADVAAAVRKSK